MRFVTICIAVACGIGAPTESRGGGDDPVRAEAEHLLRVAGCWRCYETTEEACIIERAERLVSDGGVTLTSFHAIRDHCRSVHDCTPDPPYLADDEALATFIAWIDAGPPTNGRGRPGAPRLPDPPAPEEAAGRLAAEACPHATGRELWSLRRNAAYLLSVEGLAPSEVKSELQRQCTRVEVFALGDLDYVATLPWMWKLLVGDQDDRVPVGRAVRVRVSGPAEARPEAHPGRPDAASAKPYSFDLRPLPAAAESDAPAEVAALGEPVATIASLDGATPLGGGTRPGATVRVQDFALSLAPRSAGEQVATFSLVSQGMPSWSVTHDVPVRIRLPRWLAFGILLLVTSVSAVLFQFENVILPGRALRKCLREMQERFEKLKADLPRDEGLDQRLEDSAAVVADATSAIEEGRLVEGKRLVDAVVTVLERLRMEARAVRWQQEALGIQSRLDKACPPGTRTRVATEARRAVTVATTTAQDQRTGILKGRPLEPGSWLQLNQVVRDARSAVEAADQARLQAAVRKVAELWEARGEEMREAQAAHELALDDVNARLKEFRTRAEGPTVVDAARVRDEIGRIEREASEGKLPASRAQEKAGVQTVNPKPAGDLKEAVARLFETLTRAFAAAPDSKSTDLAVLQLRSSRLGRRLAARRRGLEQVLGACGRAAAAVARNAPPEGSVARGRAALQDAVRGLRELGQEVALPALDATPTPPAASAGDDEGARRARALESIRESWPQERAWRRAFSPTIVVGSLAVAFFGAVLLAEGPTWGSPRELATLGLVGLLAGPSVGTFTALLALLKNGGIGLFPTEPLPDIGRADSPSPPSGGSQRVS